MLRVYWPTVTVGRHPGRNSARYAGRPPEHGAGRLPPHSHIASRSGSTRAGEPNGSRSRSPIKGFPYAKSLWHRLPYLRHPFLRRPAPPIGQFAMFPADRCESASASRRCLAGETPGRTEPPPPGLDTTPEKRHVCVHVLLAATGLFQAARARPSGTRSNDCVERENKALPKERPIDRGGLPCPEYVTHMGWICLILRVTVSRASVIRAWFPPHQRSAGCTSPR